MERKKSREDYLRIIYELEEGKGVRSIDLASQLGISKPSVSEMLRKLANQNLLKIEPYSKIFLTGKGKRKAEQLYNKHFIIKKFVEKFLNHNEEKSIQEAHKLEHALSDESIEIIQKLIQLGKKLPKPSYVG
jgi:DtxR family Mn-dependent transcriptional regulator